MSHSVIYTMKVHASFDEILTTFRDTFQGWRHQLSSVCCAVDFLIASINCNIISHYVGFSNTTALDLANMI